MPQYSALPCWLIGILVVLAQLKHAGGSDLNAPPGLTDTTNAPHAKLRSLGPDDCKSLSENGLGEGGHRGDGALPDQPSVGALLRRLRKDWDSLRRFSDRLKVDARVLVGPAYDDSRAFAKCGEITNGEADAIYRKLKD